jgi:hypothetical protein
METHTIITFLYFFITIIYLVLIFTVENRRTITGDNLAATVCYVLFWLVLYIVFFKVWVHQYGRDSYELVLFYIIYVIILFYI